MADGLELLFKLKAQNQASPVVHAVQADVSKLKTSFGSDFNAMQGAATRALSGITSSLTNFSGQIPVVGGALRTLSTELSTMAGESTAAGSSVAAMAGPIGVAVVAVGALVAAQGMLAAKIFELVRGVAEFEGKLFDLAQQTGVNVETLSAFEILAKTTGGSIEGISASLGIFQKNLEEAQDPTSKTAAKFKELGVETENTEEALRETLKALAAMPEGFHQTATALELFGRGGKSMLAILKEMGGDLDGTIEKFRKMGILISEEAAKAADEFNDSLAMMQFQIRGITAEVSRDATPIILESLRELSLTLRDNREAINAVGSVVGFVAGLFSGKLREGLGSVNFALVQMRPYLSAITELYERLAAAMQYVSGNMPTVNPNAVPAAGGGGTSTPADFTGFEKGFAGIGAGFHGKRRSRGGGGGGGSARVTKSAEQREAEQQEAAELKFYEDLVERVKKTVDQLNLIDISTHKYAVEQSILNGVLSKAAVEMQNMAVTEARVLDNKEKQLKLQNQLKAYFEDQAKQIKIATEGEQSYLAKSQEFIASLEKQGAVLSNYQKFWLQFNATLLDVKKTIESMPDIPLPSWATEQAEKKPADRLGDAPIPPIFKDKNLNPFDIFRKSIEEMEEGMQKTLAGGTLDAMGQAFSMIGDAVGRAVEAFVLYGSAGVSVREVTAQILASIAQQAAVQAVYELAQGLAVLALALFGIPNAGPSASAHFAAAAMYGAIAGVTAVAGRGVAGDSFKQGGAATGGSASSGSPSRGATKPTPIDIGRNQGTGVTAPGNYAHTIELKVKGDAVIKEWAQDYQLNGLTRIIISSDGQKVR